MLSLNIWHQMMPEYQVFLERSTLMLDDTEDLEDDDIEVGQRSVFRRIFKMGRGQPIRAADIEESHISVNSTRTSRPIVASAMEQRISLRIPRYSFSTRLI